MPEPLVPPSMSPSKVRPAVVAGSVLFLGCAILALHAYRYLPFFSDDALISLRYAKRFLEGNGLTWNDGERVEGYSNLLWVLLNAGLGWCGVELVLAARILGLTATVAAFVAILVAYPSNRLRDAGPSAVAVLALALSAPIAVWAIGGLEQPLVVALFAWSVVLLLRHLDAPALRARAVLLPAVLLGLMTVARVDALLLAGALALGFILARGISFRSFLLASILALVPLACWGAQLGFRWLYYGELVPNTALVKVALTEHHRQLGMLYLKRGATAFLPLLGLSAAMLVAALWSARHRRGLLLLVMPLLLWVPYVVLVGGDIFPAHRQLAVMVVVLALVVAHGLASLADRRRLGAVAHVVAVVSLVWLGHRQWHDPRNQTALVEKWEWDGKIIGLMFKKAFGPQRPLFAVTASGALPFWSELPALDMYGLNDWYLPRHPPKSFGQGYPGHELGDGRYILSRRPDLILFHIWGYERPGCLNGQQLLASPEFRRDYTLVTFETRDPRVVRTVVFVRIEGRIGIQRSATAVTAPGLLFNRNRCSVAHLDSSGRMGVAVDRDCPAVLGNLLVPAGDWDVKSTYTGAAPRLTVKRSGTTEILAGFVGEGRFQSNGGAIDVELSAPHGSHVAAVELRRLLARVQHVSVRRSVTDQRRPPDLGQRERARQ
jgi:arabinofuranosyltransferase